MIFGPELPESANEGDYFYNTMERQLYAWLGGWVPITLDTPPIYVIREWP